MIIIWKGFGILVPIIAVAGFVIGGVLGAATGSAGVGVGLGMGMAALGIWLLEKALMPKRPRFNPAVGPVPPALPMPKSSGSSFFFVPLMGWVWLIAILSVPVVAMGILSDVSGRKQMAKPGYKEFSVAEEQASTSSREIGSGNTPAAGKAATAFATDFRRETLAIFSGKKLSTDDFHAYCQETPDTIVMICEVPGYRHFKSADAKATMDKLAWAACCKAVGALDPEHKKTLMIGLKGLVSYGSIQKGKTTAATPERLPSNKDVFYPFFVPAS